MGVHVWRRALRSIRYFVRGEQVLFELHPEWLHLVRPAHGLRGTAGAETFWEALCKLF